MESADLILTNATVVTMDSTFRVLDRGAVAVRGEQIVAVGPTDEIARAYPGAQRTDCHERALLPGLVNAHTHVPMTLLRGLADDRRLDVWLLGYIMPVEREFVSPDFVRLGALLGCAEMIRGGVTTFADMYYYEASVAKATAEAGLRALCSQTVMKFPTPDAPSFEDSLAAAHDFISEWKGHPLIVPSVAPHAAYTCTPEILRACADMAIEFDVPLHTHIAETLQEVEDWREEYGMPVVPWIKKLGLLEAKVVAAHCVHIDGGEMNTLHHAGAGVSHNPSSNLKLASGFAPVVEMLNAGLNVGIGTDGSASNNDLDMFEEMRLAAFIAKAVTSDPTALPARLTLAMATRLGAQALHMGHLIGSIEPGKRADLILIDLEGIHTRPRFDRDPASIYSRIVYTAKAADVTDVIVNGRWLMRDRQLKTIEVAPLLEAAEAYARRIDTFLVEREQSVLSKLVAIGGAEQEESYEVQLKIHLDDLQPVLGALSSGSIPVLRKTHYHEYDTYFLFGDASADRLRHREDEFIDEAGNVFNVRYRLTLTGPAAEREFPNSVVLSRSRFIAPANHSLRFYREYFKPTGESEVNKDRRRWKIDFHGDEFFVNIDQLLQPALPGYYLEVKSRTWSRKDAEDKAALISELVRALGVEAAVAVAHDYPDLSS